MHSHPVVSRGQGQAGDVKDDPVVGPRINGHVDPRTPIDSVLELHGLALAVRVTKTLPRKLHQERGWTGAGRNALGIHPDSRAARAATGLREPFMTFPASFLDGKCPITGRLRAPTPGVKADSFPRVLISRQMHRVQGGVIVARLTVADQLGIIGVPALGIGVIGVAAPALRAKAGLEAHVMRVKVSEYGSPVFMIAHGIPPGVIMIIRGGVPGISLWWGWIAFGPAAVHHRLCPVAVLARKGRRRYHRWWILCKRQKRGDRDYQVGIMAHHAVLRGGKICAMMPTVAAEHIVPTVTAAGRAVVDDDNPRRL